MRDRVNLTAKEEDHEKKREMRAKNKEPSQAEHEETLFSKFIDSIKEEKRKEYNSTQAGQRFYFKSESVKFTGREKEVQYLNDFRSEEDDVLWTAITGPSGSGKSRLMYEYVLRYSGEDEWKMIFVNPQYIDEILKMKYWNYYSNLFIVIDYIISYADKIGQWIEALANVKIQNKIRIVLLERENKLDKSESFLNKKPLWINKLEEKVTSQHSLQNSLYKQKILDISILDKEQMRTIIKSYAERQQRKISGEGINHIIKQLMKIDEKYLRPIYLLFIADAYLKGKKNEWDKEQLEKWLNDDELQKTEKNFCFDDNKKAFNSYKTLLCIATMCSGLEWKSEEADKVFEKYIDKIEEYAESCGKGIGDVLNIREYYDDGVILPMEPDLMGEYFCISYLENEIYTDDRRGRKLKEINDWIQFACKFKAGEYMSFLSRLVNDYPQSKVCSVECLFQPPKSGVLYDYPLTYVSILLDLVYKQEIDEKRKTVNKVKEYAEENKESHYIIAYAECLGTMVYQVGWEEDMKIIKEIEKMIELYPEINETLKETYSCALYNSTLHREKEKIEVLVEKLKYLYSDNQENFLIKKHYIMALANLSVYKNIEELRKIIKEISIAVESETDTEQKNELKLQYAFVLTMIIKDSDDKCEVEKYIGLLKKYSNLGSKFKLEYANGLVFYNCKYKKDGDKILSILKSLMSVRDIQEEIKIFYGIVLSNTLKGYDKNKARLALEKVKNIYYEYKENKVIREAYSDCILYLSLSEEFEEHKKSFDVLRKLVEEDKDDKLLSLNYLKSAIYLYYKCDNDEEEEIFSTIQEEFSKKYLDVEGAYSLIGCLKIMSIEFKAIQVIDSYMTYNKVDKKFKLAYAEALKDGIDDSKSKNDALAGKAALNRLYQFFNEYNDSEF